MTAARQGRVTLWKKYGLGLILFSGLVVVLLIVSFLYWHAQDTLQNALGQARDYYNLNLHYRAWNAKLGGVYAAADRVAPNPYLDVPERELTLADGRRLTLINPAYMTQMVFEQMAGDPNQAVFNRLVSLKPLNPDNTATPWEARGLQHLEQHPEDDYFELTELDGRETLHYLGPFVTQTSCLKCHEKQGYKVGDLRGAISISIPMTKYREAEQALNLRFVSSVLLLWMGFSVFWAVVSKRRFDKEIALQLSEERNRTIFEASQAGIFMVDPNGAITIANRRMTELFGYSPTELIGKSYPELVAADEQQTGDSRMRQLMAGELPAVSLERHYLRRDGTTFWGHLSGRRIADHEGRLMALVGIIADITPLRTALEEVNQAKDYFSSILNAIADPVFVKDEEFRIVEANAAECRMLKRERREVIGKFDDDFFPPEQVAVFRACDQLVLQSGESLVNEEEVTYPDGRTHIVLAHKSCYVDPEGRRFVVGVLRDVTEQRALERQAMRSAQLAAVGELASGVAHEINNPITGVINYAQLLLDREAVAEKDRQLLSRIIREGERVAAIVRSLLFFSRDGGEERTRIDVRELLVDVLQLSNDRMVLEGIDLQLNLPEEQVAIHVNPQQIEQVLINLLSNARYALNERAKSNPAPKELILSVAVIYRETGPVCRFSLRDNGTGIPDEIVDRLGQPFVTTKPAGVGTGLGLSISNDIVKRHGGELRIDSRQGEYTEVIVELPDCQVGQVFG